MSFIDLKNNYEISIVFPTYQRAHEVRTTLDILRKSLSMKYEVIIIDNSPEPSDCGSLLPNERIIFANANLGTAARNIGNEEATAPFILQLDDDSHPLDGAVESAVNFLKKAPTSVAGVTSQVFKIDGTTENTPLLPSVFHGCGVIFRKSAVDVIGKIYPEDFLFYGEEYWSTLLIYSFGYTLEHIPEMKICHRFSGTNRSKEHILYRLSVNNRRTWPCFLPSGKTLDVVMSDTARRYELVSAKEGVSQAFVKASNDSVTIPSNYKKIDDEQFAKYALLPLFDGLMTKPFLSWGRAVLCGCGKFPTFWAEHLLSNGMKEILLGDSNPGIAGKDYSGRTVLSEKEIIDVCKKGIIPIIGHCSRGDSMRWKALLAKEGVSRIAELPF